MDPPYFLVTSQYGTGGGDQEDTGLSTGEIVGIVFSVLVFFIVLIIVVVGVVITIKYCRRKKSRQAPIRWVWLYDINIHVHA